MESLEKLRLRKAATNAGMKDLAVMVRPRHHSRSTGVKARGRGFQPDESARKEADDFRDCNMTWPARPSTIDQFEFQQRNDLIEYLNRSAIERGFPLN